MRIAVDAMGSDNSPDIEVSGAVMASLRDDALEVVLVGNEEAIRAKLDGISKKGNITVVHAGEAIGMHESPVMAVRKKKDASLLVGMRMVKQGEADGFVSAGNTGAVMVAARTVLGTVPGVSRAALSQGLPTSEGSAVVLDLGANVDCSTRHLCEFAEMGKAYSHYALGVENPRIGLLNIGEEGMKGTQVAREVHQRLSAIDHINFVGNVEPSALYKGAADVVVCDGFIGNLFLKTSEAAASFMGKMMRAHFESSSMSKIGAVLARKALKDIKERVDPNEYPGAPLLGANGIVIITHGSCTGRGIANGVKGACVAVENKLLDHIRENIADLRRAENPGPDGGAAPERTETGRAEAPDAGEEGE